MRPHLSCDLSGRASRGTCDIADAICMQPLRRPETVPAAGFGEGFEAFLGGINFIITTPSVWLHALVPALLVLVLACGLSWLGVWGAGHTVNAFLGPSSGFWSTAGSWILTIILAVAAVLFALLLAVILAQPFSVFALEAIVQAQERALGARSAPRPTLLGSMLLSLSIALFTLAAALPIYVVLLIVDMVYPPAMVFTVPLRLLFSAWLLAWNFLDYPLALRGMGLAARLRWIAQRPGAFTGFGLAWAVVLIFPGMALLLLPMGVAGATRLVVGEEAADRDWR
jgi:CysZ protein